MCELLCCYSVNGAYEVVYTEKQEYYEEAFERANKLAAYEEYNLILIMEIGTLKTVIHNGLVLGGEKEDV